MTRTFADDVADPPPRLVRALVHWVRSNFDGSLEAAVGHFLTLARGEAAHG